MNYNYDNIPCPDENNKKVPLPEPSLSDVVRENTIHINNIKYVLENMYQHLYGATDERTPNCSEKPECLRDELIEQSHTLLIINENLARISSKLGM